MQGMRSKHEQRPEHSKQAPFEANSFRDFVQFAYFAASRDSFIRSSAACLSTALHFIVIVFYTDVLSHSLRFPLFAQCLSAFTISPLARLCVVAFGHCGRSLIQYKSSDEENVCMLYGCICTCAWERINYHLPYGAVNFYARIQKWNSNIHTIRVYFADETKSFQFQDNEQQKFTLIWKVNLAVFLDHSRSMQHSIATKTTIFVICFPLGVCVVLKQWKESAHTHTHTPFVCIQRQ